MRPQALGEGRPKQVELLKHYVIVRDDEMMTVGSIVAQTIHATNESCEGPLPSGSFAYALAARGPDHLRELAKKLWDAEIPHTVIYEPDSPFNGEPTAIGIWPLTDTSSLKRIVSSLPLIGKSWVRK